MVMANTSGRLPSRRGTATIWRGPPARPEFRSLAGPHAGPPIYRISLLSATRRPSIRTLGRYTVVETTLRPEDVGEGVADAQDLAIRIVARSILADTVRELADCASPGGEEAVFQRLTEVLDKNTESV